MGAELRQIVGIVICKRFDFNDEFVLYEDVEIEGRPDGSFLVENRNRELSLERKMPSGEFVAKSRFVDALDEPCASKLSMYFFCGCNHRVKKGRHFLKAWCSI